MPEKKSEHSGRDSFFGVVCNKRAHQFRMRVICANEKLKSGKLKRWGAGMDMKIFPCQGTIQLEWRPGIGRTDGLSVKFMQESASLGVK